MRTSSPSSPARNVCAHFRGGWTMQSPSPISCTFPFCQERPEPPSTKTISSSAPSTCAGVDHLPGSISTRLTPTLTEPAALPRSLQLEARWPSSLRRGSTSSQWAMKSVVEDTAFHPACDRNDLAGDVPGDLVGGERDDLARDVLGSRHLAERHRAGDPADEGLVESATGHRGVRPAGADRVHARARCDADDLVLEAQQEPVHDRGLRGRVVGVSRFPEEPGCRADQDEAAVAIELAKEAAGSEEGRRQVRAQGLFPTLEWQVPDRHVFLRPDTGDRG